MTSSSSSGSRSDDDSRADTPPSRNRKSVDLPVMVKEGLRQSIIAKRRSRGEKQLKIEYNEPQQMELTPAEIEKKERRREQNRRAAQRCRNKKRLTQKSVIQSYEKIMAKNRDLQIELEKVKRELNGLRDTYNYHSMCCPAFAKVKCESTDIVKLETLTDDDLHDITQDSLPCELNISYLHQDKLTTIPHLLTNPSRTGTITYRHAQSPLPVSSEKFIPLFKEKPDDGVHVDMNFLRQTELQIPPQDINPQHSWQYSPSSFTSQNQSSTSCMFNESLLLKSRDHHLQKQRKHSENMQDKQQQQFHIEQVVNPQPDVRHEYAHLYGSHIPITSSTIPSVSLVSAQSHLYVDKNGLVQSQNSPCQVVPSLRSPGPNCGTPRTSCSQNITRHRSVSGGSVSASETARSCTEEKPFSSVSSEGSLYVDNPASMFQDQRTLEVPDMDADEVFMSTSSGGDAPVEEPDVNNNLDNLPDYNRVVENTILQYLMEASGMLPPELPDNDTIARSSDNNLVSADDVSDALRILTAMDNSAHSADLMSNFLPDIQIIDY